MRLSECLCEIIGRPSCALIRQSGISSIVCCGGFAAAFASKPARQIFDPVASPQVLRKIAVAQHDARSKLRSLVDPGFAPQHEKQAASDDAVARAVQHCEGFGQGHCVVLAVNGDIRRPYKLIGDEQASLPQ